VPASPAPGAGPAPLTSGANRAHAARRTEWKHRSSSRTKGRENAPSSVRTGTKGQQFGVWVVATSGSLVGLPWESLNAFLRIATNPRATPEPLSPTEAWGCVEEWLASRSAWIPRPTDGHAEVLGGLIQRYRVTGNLMPDAHLSALALEHGLTICSADSDFARFTEVRWENPLG